MTLINCRGRWNRYRRAILSRTVVEDGQHVLDFARRESIIYTNLSAGSDLAGDFEAAGLGRYLEPDRLLALYHGRGRDELVHRALKEFYGEELPFKRFAPNTAFYYVMLVAFFLYEAFKEDVCKEIIPVAAYVTRMRRQVIDIAAKVIRTSGKTILKVTKATWRALNLKTLWDRAARPPSFAWQ